MKKSMIKKILSLCAVFVFALVAVVTLTAPNKLSVNAEEQLFNILEYTAGNESNPNVSMEELKESGWKEPEVGQKLGSIFYFVPSSSGPIIIASEKYVFYRYISGMPGSDSSHLYLAELVVPGSANNLTSSSELTKCEVKNAQDISLTHKQVKVELLVDFGEITYFYNCGWNMNKFLYDVSSVPTDEPTTPDEPTNPGDGTETPDDGTETPDDGTEEPKDATTDKVANWLNETFGMNTNGNTVGAIAIVLAGAFIIKTVFGRK